MRILHITTKDSGGAGSQSRMLHKSLLKKDIESDMLTFIKNTNTERIHLFANIFSKSSLVRTIVHYFNFLPSFFREKILMAGKNKDHEIFTNPSSCIDVTKHPLYEKADLIHLHFCAYFLDWHSFFTKNKKPVVITLHDMNAVTGGCHYSEDCIGYMEKCRNCPQLRGTLIQKTAETNLRKKSALIKNAENIAFITPSRWMEDCTRRSVTAKNRIIKTIRYGIDSDKFKRFDKSESRKKLGLPINKQIILYIADSFSRGIKGGEIFLESLKHLKEKEKKMLLMAGGGRQYRKNVLPVNTIRFPFIESSEMLSRIYSAADVTVLPSKYETFSLVTAESMLCGTPVAAFNASALPELINHKKDGYLAEPYSPEDLAKGIEYCIKENINSDLSNAARKKILEEYPLQKMADSYLEVYRSMI